jgi:CheY-like chemotaxis protein
MPEMDGFTVVEKLKDNEETRPIPIIIVSAKELTPSERQFLTGEVEVLLQKGLFSETELLQDVSQALEDIHKEKEVVLD